MLMIDEALLWIFTILSMADDAWWRDCSWILAKFSKFATVKSSDEALWKKVRRNEKWQIDSVVGCAASSHECSARCLTIPAMIGNLFLVARPRHRCTSPSEFDFSSGATRWTTTRTKSLLQQFSLRSSSLSIARCQSLRYRDDSIWLSRGDSCWCWSSSWSSAMDAECTKSACDPSASNRMRNGQLAWFSVFSVTSKWADEIPSNYDAPSKENNSSYGDNKLLEVRSWLFETDAERLSLAENSIKAFCGSFCLFKVTQNCGTKGQRVPNRCVGSQANRFGRIACLVFCFLVICARLPWGEVH